jgi:hypothetical protein
MPNIDFSISPKVDTEEISLEELDKALGLD